MTKKIIKEVKNLTIEEVVEICKKQERCFGCPLALKVCITGDLAQINLDEKVEIKVDINQDNTTEKYKSKTEGRVMNKELTPLQALKEILALYNEWLAHQKSDFEFFTLLNGIVCKYELLNEGGVVK